MDAKILQMMPGARNIVKVCAGTKPGENVLIIVDYRTSTLARPLAAAVQEAGGIPTIAIMSPRKLGEEPPKPIAAAMLEADVIITPTTTTMMYCRATTAARQAGARFIPMSGANEETMMGESVNLDVIANKAMVDAVAAAYAKGETIRFTTPAGTDLTASIKGRRVNNDTGLCHQPGQSNGMPCIEVNSPPVPGTTNGTLVVDGSMSVVGLVHEPIKITVKDGKITNIEGGREAKELAKMLANANDPNVYAIAELALGLNPKAKVRGVLIEDEAAYGTMHVGIGDSINLGGENKAPLHIDVVSFQPTVYIDDEVIMKDGEVVIPY